MENDYILEKLRPFFFKLFLCALEDLEKSLKTHYGLFSLYIFSWCSRSTSCTRRAKRLHVPRLHVQNVFMCETSSCTKHFMYETCETSSCTTCLHVGKVFMCETSSCTRRVKRNVFMYETCFVLISSQFCLANVENSTDEISSP